MLRFQDKKTQNVIWHQGMMSQIIKQARIFSVRPKSALLEMNFVYNQHQVATRNFETGEGKRIQTTSLSIINQEG